MEVKQENVVWQEYSSDTPLQLDRWYVFRVGYKDSKGVKQIKKTGPRFLLKSKSSIDLYSDSLSLETLREEPQRIVKRESNDHPYIVKCLAYRGLTEREKRYVRKELSNKIREYHGFVGLSAILEDLKHSKGWTDHSTDKKALLAAIGKTEALIHCYVDITEEDVGILRKVLENL
ncbi:MAG: hypothetical protein LBD11_01770 [Candidatus Peribacteria bacterium]|jgi:hypothetical protein|nr:hypothetical protein [Candidatus Peribacteria bacterium]